MTALSSYFIYIPGIIIFLVGSGQVRQWLRLRRQGRGARATVKKCGHVVKKDRQGRDIYNYYDVLVDCEDGGELHVKSPTEYAEGQLVRIARSGKDAQPVVAEHAEQLLHPVTVMAGGALLVLLGLEENRGNDAGAMFYLVFIIIGAGVSLVAGYAGLRRRRLVPVEATVIDVYARQLSKETKIIRGSKFTYYPVVRFEIGGRQNIRRCAVNSSRKDSFTPGSSMTLYYDAAAQVVTERHAHPGLLAAGIALLLVGLLAGASLVTVLIQM